MGRLDSGVSLLHPAKLTSNNQLERSNINMYKTAPGPSFHGGTEKNDDTANMKERKEKKITVERP